MQKDLRNEDGIWVGRSMQNAGNIVIEDVLQMCRIKEDYKEERLPDSKTNIH